MSEPSVNVIKSFNKNILNYKKRFESGFYYIYPCDKCDAFHGCRKCQSYLLKLEGIPFNKNNIIFGEIFNVNNPIKTDNTVIKFLDKSNNESTDFVTVTGQKIQVHHLSDVLNIKPKNDILNRFFNTTNITVSIVNKTIKDFRSWFQININKMRNLVDELRNDIIKTLVFTIKDLYYIMELDDLDFLNWINANSMRSLSVLKLIKTELTEDIHSNKRILSNKFDPTNIGLNKQEQTLKKTYNDASITVLWDLIGDIDIHVSLLKGDEKIHIYYGNKSYEGIKLDYDNIKGGSNSKEIVSFNPNILIDKGILEIKIFICLYHRVCHTIPFEVVIEQNGYKEYYKDEWNPSDHVGCSEKYNCFIKTIMLKKSKKTEQHLRHKLPGDMRILNNVDIASNKSIPTLDNSGTLKAGYGNKCYALCNTPIDFKHNITPIPVGGKDNNFQLPHDLLYDKTININGEEYAYVGKFLLTLIPFNLYFTKEMFQFGNNGLIASDKYRGKAFSPCFNAEIDIILGKCGMPDILSRIIMSYIDYDYISLYTPIYKNNNDTEVNKKWWGKYL